MATPLNILLVQDTLNYAGTESHVLSLAQHLNALPDTMATIATPRQSQTASRAHALNVPTVALQRFPGPVNLLAVIQVTLALLSRRYDVLHAHNGRTSLVVALACILAGRGKCVVTQHFLTPDHITKSGWSAAILRNTHRWINRHIHHRICVSQAVLAAMIARSDAECLDSVTVVHNGIDVKKLAGHTLQVNMKSVRGALDVPVDALIILCAARLEPEKSISVLIDAMVGVVATFPDAVCIIAGDGSLRPVLQAQINSSGLSRSVKLIGFHQEIADLMAVSAVFVLPAEAEPFGLVLTEAMASSLPVIACGVGGPIEIVSHGVTGFLVEPRDSAMLAEVINRLLGDASLRLQMAKASLERVNALFTAAEMARKTKAVYIMATAGRGTR